MDRRIFVLAAFALGGCATLPRPAKPTSRVFGELEPLYAMKSGPEGLTIRVASGGCTTKADFTFYIDHPGKAPALAFGRKHVETCKSSGKLQSEFTFTWVELGLSARTPVVLLNPISEASLPLD